MYISDEVPAGPATPAPARTSKLNQSIDSNDTLIRDISPPLDLEKEYKNEEK